MVLWSRRKANERESERESLLASDDDDEHAMIHESPVDSEATTVTTPIVEPQSNARLFLSLLLDSIPVILSYTLQNSIQTSSILVAGRLGPDELSAASVSLMIAMVSGKSSLSCRSFDPTVILGWCVALGGTTALDTLGSHAFGAGPPNHKSLSTHLFRCILLLWVLLLPVLVLWTFSERVLLALGQPETLSRDAQRFLRVLVLGAPGYIGFESLKKYLQCQGIMRLPTLTLALVFPINVALNIALVHHTKLGLLGAPVALNVTYWLMFVLLGVLTYFSPTHRHNDTWNTPNLRSVLDWRACILFLRLAIPGILMVGTEWAAFEIVALAAGQLGSLPLAAQSVIMTTDQILNTIPFGIGVAASSRVGTLLGASSPTVAKRAAHASALLSVVMGVLVMVVMLSTKDVYGYLFSDDTDVVRLVAHVMPLVASFQVADGLAGSCGGVLRGQGRQHLGALFNLIAYYVLALPMGIALAFPWGAGMGLAGLWIGQVVALYIVGGGEYAVVWLGTDWEREVRRGKERARGEGHGKGVGVGVGVGDNEIVHGAVEEGEGEEQTEGCDFAG